MESLVHDKEETGRAVVGCFGPIMDIVAATRQCVLQPIGFLVAWNGVLTLAYSGFPPSLERLKIQLSARFGTLPRENPGSLWPKTSLGALKNNQRLNLEQLQTLEKICREATEALSGAGQQSTQVIVDSLALVFYECRCLERKLCQTVCKLSGELDPSEPSKREQGHVNKVLTETSDPDYWFHASKDGHRESHYKGDSMGVTLVHELGASSSITPQHSENHLQGVIQKFCEDVESKLPGMYSWFATNSLHVTIRGLIN